MIFPSRPENTEEPFKILQTTLAQSLPRHQYGKRTQRGEEPSVLARRVSLLQSLLHGLLSILPLRLLLEGIRGDNSLQSLQLECVACWHEVVVVDDLDERLDLRSLGLGVLGHAAGDLRRVALDAGDQGVRVWV